jgi:MFS family permease
MPLDIRKERLRRRQRLSASAFGPSRHLAPLSIRLCSLCRTCYYGNVVLAAAIGGILAGSSGHSFMVGVYTSSFMSDLQLSRSVVSLIWTVTLVASSLYVQGVGRLVDRMGAPRVMRAAVLPYFGAMLLLAQARGVGTLTLGYLAVRMLGPETIDFCVRNCLNQWWVRRRGWAFGILNAAGALMAVLQPPTSTPTLTVNQAH